MAPTRADQVAVTVLVDNRVLGEDLKPAYGISFYIEVRSGRRIHRVLFDTGPSEEILRHNARHLGVSLKNIERLVISHFHKDHYGAMNLAVEEAEKLVIYVPEEPWFARRVLDKARRMGHRVVHASMFTQITPGLYALGPVTNTREISLEFLLRGGGGGLLVGCGHGGLRTIVKWARYVERFLLIAGGFHLKEEPDEKAAELAEWLRDRVKAEVVVPLHCSNHEEVFSRILGAKHVRGGAGTSLVVSERGISLRENLKIKA